MLGDFLKKRCEELDISQRELARRCEMSHSEMNDIIKGKIAPSEIKVKTLVKLSGGAGVKLERISQLAAPEAKNVISPAILEIAELLEAVPEENLISLLRAAKFLNQDQMQKLAKDLNPIRSKRNNKP